MKKSMLLFCVFCIFIFCEGVFADTLYLKKGTQLTGKVIMQDNEKVLFRVGDEEDGVEATYFKDEILRIDTTEIPSFITSAPAEDKQLKAPKPIFAPAESSPTAFGKKPLVAEPITDAQIQEQPETKEVSQADTQLQSGDESQIKKDKDAKSQLEDLIKDAKSQDLSKVTQIEGLDELTKDDLLLKEKNIVEELIPLLSKEEKDYFSKINSIAEGSLQEAARILTNPEALAQDAEQMLELTKKISSGIENIIKQLQNLDVPGIFANFHNSYLDNLTMTKDLLNDIVKGDILSSHSKAADLRTMNVKVQEELSKILEEKKKLQ